MIPITYNPGWVPDPDADFNCLWNELPWVRHDKVPRREYYTNTLGVPYAYGQAEYARTYESQPSHWLVRHYMDVLEVMGHTFEAVFINGYDDASDFLGWHSDDSPEMDDNRPIAIVSLGAERDIWFRKKPHQRYGGPAGFSTQPTQIEKLRLEHGSLCLMHPGMQDTHQHRIPKCDWHCGPRLSLTFRGYVAK